MRNETLKCTRNAFAKNLLLQDILLLYRSNSILLSIISPAPDLTEKIGPKEYEI